LIVFPSTGSHSGRKESEPGRRDGLVLGGGTKPPSPGRELLDFVLHGKRWWLTPIVIVLILMAVFALVAGTAPVAPFIYSLF
jgi:hypothetical protein